MLLPSSCPLCATPGPAPCGPCIDALEPAGRRPPPRGLDTLAALLSYEGAGREVVARLKYRNRRSALAWLAAGMAAGVAAGSADIVTWVPTTRRRRHGRGFDQAELLARAVARHLRLPCRPLLRRVPGPPQTGQPLEQRQRGPTLVPRTSFEGRVLVVDDVITSGATLRAAALALREGGACEVRATVAASTPRRNGANHSRW